MINFAELLPALHELRKKFCTCKFYGITEAYHKDDCPYRVEYWKIVPKESEEEKK